MAAQATHSANLSVTGSYADMILDTKTFDTHGVYSTTTGVYTVAVPGNYRVTADGQFSGATLAAGQGVSFRLMKNGVVQYTLSNQASANATVACPFEYIVQANAGDTLKIQVLNGCTTPILIAAKLQFEMIQGPSQIQAATIVAATYTGLNAVTSYVGAQVFKYFTKAFDRTSSYSPTTGLFTCPAPGIYRVSAKYNTSTAGNLWQYVGKNGSTELYRLGFTTTANTDGVGSALIECVTGDTLGVYSSGVMTAADGNSFAFVNFERISGVN